MNSSEYDTILRQKLEEELKKRITRGEVMDHTLWEAMEYSLLAGGKRIRPMLLMMTGRSLGASDELLMPFACALEMIHTYSLIHDDLPAMDNDDYRRGRLTNHKVYGDAAAILAGDGLLNLAFETMADTVSRQKQPENMAKAAAAMSYISACAGPKGMIAGQIADMESENRRLDLSELTYIEFNKTSRLLMAAMKGGALLAGAEKPVVDNLELSDGKTGLAFQIQDDILDVEGTLETLGKMPDSDSKSAKSTFVSLYGLENAKKQVESLTKEALSLLNGLPGDEGQKVRDLVESLSHREH